jgi:hypothetical protein
MAFRRGALTKDIGSTGLNDSGWGVIREDFLAEWNTSAKRTKRVDEMLRNSSIVAALRMAIEMPIRDVDWFYTSEQGDEDPRLQLLDDARENMSHSWNDHIIDALLMVFYGWSAFTITYDKVGGNMLWRKFKMLGHDTVQRWYLADDGGLEGIQQWPHLWSEPIPIERMVLYRFRKTKNNPEGESILRPAWLPWYYVKNIQQIEAIGIERNLAGLPVITMPEDADTTESTDENTDYGRAHKIVRSIRNDEQSGVVLPFGWELSTLSGSGGSGMTKTVDAGGAIGRHEKRILMAALAQFLILGMDNIGALATFEGGTDFFNMSVNAVADIIAETHTKYPVARLLALNGMDAEGIRMEHGRIGQIDMEKLSAILTAIGGLVTWTPEDEAWLRGAVRLPEKSIEDIAELQEAAQARQDEQMAQMRPQQPGQQMSVYAADNAPDDDERQRFERKWYRKARDHFGDQYKRLMRDVKRAY